MLNPRAANSSRAPSATPATGTNTRVSTPSGTGSGRQSHQSLPTPAAAFRKSQCLLFDYELPRDYSLHEPISSDVWRSGIGDHNPGPTLRWVLAVPCTYPQILAPRRDSDAGDLMIPTHDHGFHEGFSASRRQLSVRGSASVSRALNEHGRRPARRAIPS